MLIRPRAPLNCMHKTMGAEGFSYTGFSSESFRRRFLRQNVPQAKSGRAEDVEIYTKCTEKRSYARFSVFLGFSVVPFYLGYSTK